MAQSAVDKIPSGPILDALTAEKVFGWQKVHTHQGALVGRKQDKAGHWRRAKVPNYSTNPLHSYESFFAFAEGLLVNRFDESHVGGVQSNPTVGYQSLLIGDFSRD
jgi:hypothetical protein